MLGSISRAHNKLPWLLSYATSLLIFLAGFLWLIGVVNATKQDVECLLAAWLVSSAIYPTFAYLWCWFSDGKPTDDGTLMQLVVVTITDATAVLGLLNDLGLFNYSGSDDAANFNLGLCFFVLLFICFANCVSALVYYKSYEKLARMAPER